MEPIVFTMLSAMTGHSSLMALREYLIILDSMLQDASHTSVLSSGRMVQMVQVLKILQVQVRQVKLPVLVKDAVGV